MKKTWLCISLVCFGICLANQAIAQAWPNRTVKIIVPAGPGGVSDLMARYTADRLSKVFGVPFVIENRSGGGGALGTGYAIRSQPDGYTLWFGGGAQFTSAPLIKKLDFDPVKGLVPISMVSINGLGLVVPSTLPVDTLPRFVKYVKERPDEINYGVSGVGQSSHLAAALFASREKLNMVMVPYQSVPPTIIGLLSGQVQMYFGNMIDVVNPVQSGKLKLLAVSSEKRSKQFPDVPAISEFIPNFTFTSWVGYFAPAGTPEEIITKLSKAISKICHEEAVVDKIASVGMTAVGSNPEYVAAAIKKDLPIAKEAVEAAHLSPQ